MKIWDYTPGHPFPFQYPVYVPLHRYQTWKNSGSLEREKGRPGLEHRQKHHGQHQVPKYPELLLLGALAMNREIPSVLYFMRMLLK